MSPSIVSFWIRDLYMRPMMCARRNHTPRYEPFNSGGRNPNFRFVNASRASRILVAQSKFLEHPRLLQQLRRKPRETVLASASGVGVERLPSKPLLLPPPGPPRSTPGSPDLVASVWRPSEKKQCEAPAPACGSDSYLKSKLLGLDSSLAMCAAVPCNKRLMCATRFFMLQRWPLYSLRKPLYSASSASLAGPYLSPMLTKRRPFSARYMSLDLVTCVTVALRSAGPKTR